MSNTLPAQIKLQHAGGFSGTVTLPGSKSISNRALLLASLAEGTTELSNFLLSDDTRYMLSALHSLGIEITQDEVNSRISVTGNGGLFSLSASANKQSLYLGNAGTAMRPLIAILAASQGEFELKGDSRMYERPAGPLVETLCQMGADIRYLSEDGYPPLMIKGAPLAGGKIQIDGSLSSQYVSALLMLLPMLQQDTELELVGEPVSLPYIQLTIAMIRQFGCSVEAIDDNHFRIPGNQCYKSPGRYFVESDASSASYFLAAAAIAGGPVRVTGIGADSLQGDKEFALVLREMGADVYMASDFIEVKQGESGLKGGEFDLNAIPDAAMTIATTALFARGTTTIKNVYNWRLKETDRLHAMATELRKTGADVTEWDDGIQITPPQHIKRAVIDTYDDHRMAMCFALLCFADESITINDPGCCSKTYPEFFIDFQQLCR